MIAFHQSGYCDFKTYYTQFVCRYLRHDFPNLVSYTRMLKLIQNILVPLCSYMTHRRAKPTGTAYIDSTKLQVCHNLRIPRHKVFKDVAERGNRTMGWFYALKLHLIINDQGDILAMKVTTGSVGELSQVDYLLTFKFKFSLTVF